MFKKYCVIVIAVLLMGSFLTACGDGGYENLSDDESIQHATGFDPDLDDDGVDDSSDNCTKYNPDQLDSDDDGYGDVCDNCPDTWNGRMMSCRTAAQADANSDGEGDVCDMDSDSDDDGVNDWEDNCPSVSNPEQINSDDDPRGDACQISVQECAERMQEEFGEFVDQL